MAVTKLIPSPLIALMCFVLPMTAYADGRDKCEQAADVSKKLRFQSYADMALNMDRVEGPKSLAVILAAMNEEQAATLPRCRSAVKKDRTLRKSLECVIGAKNALALTSCQASTLLLTGNQCAMSVDNTMRISRKLVARQIRMKGWDVDAMMAQVYPQLLNGRAKALIDCHASLAKDKSKDPEQSLRCNASAKGEAEFMKCEGTKVEKNGALASP